MCFETPKYSPINLISFLHSYGVIKPISVLEHIQFLSILGLIHLWLFYVFLEYQTLLFSKSHPTPFALLSLFHLFCISKSLFFHFLLFQLHQFLLFIFFNIFLFSNLSIARLIFSFSFHASASNIL